MRRGRRVPVLDASQLLAERPESVYMALNYAFSINPHFEDDRFFMVKNAL